MKDKIKIGVSSCLVGEKVRWNGEHKQDRYVQEELGRFFEYVPVCPEVEIGMGIPRETVALYGTRENPRMVSRKTRTDWTEKMNAYLDDRMKQLRKDALCGYIFKSKSPSCGLARVPVYSAFGSDTARHRSGLFAEAFRKAFPLIPTEDEGRLHDSGIRENFIVRVFSFHRLQNLANDFSRKAMVEFHTRHKFLLLAHSRKNYDKLGQWVAQIKGSRPKEILERYSALFMEALSYKSTPKKNSDVLMHMLGFLKKCLSREEKEDILETIGDYRNEIIPLIVPVTLIRHQVKKHNIEYLRDQVYLNPHPKELMLRNRV